MKAVNPATGALVAEYPNHTPDQAARAVEQTHAAYEKWSQTSFSHRAALMQRAAAILRAQKVEHARLMAVEMGKPVTQGEAEVEKCAWVCEYYAEHAERFLRSETIVTDAARSFVAFQPLGVVLAVMPWNFPFWQVFRFAAPALMAGNAGLLKHASIVPGCALAIERVLEEAGFPTHVFQSLLVPAAGVPALIEHPRIVAVTLTGSTPAGQSVASTAGRVVKKVVLELGGSDPYLILADADVPTAARICAASRLINNGQSCIAAKRFIVVESRLAEFEKHFVAAMGEARLGDPLEPETTLGPQATVELRDELHQQAQRSLAAGARLLIGGEAGRHAFYPATVLTQVRKGMPAFDEELFGPVAAVVSARDEAEAIALANDSSFGLGAAVFTSNVSRGEEIAAHRLEAGCCFVNDFVRSDPRLPFGGIKGSGFGRELSSFGIREFVNIKTVYVK